MPHDVIIASASLTSVVVGWMQYLSTIPRHKVPVTPVLALALTIGGAAGGAAAIWLSAGQGAVSGWVVGLSSGGILLGLGFVGLLKQAPVPAGDIQVAVGEAMLPFTTKDSTGADFDSDSLRGGWVLFKFFRGLW